MYEGLTMSATMWGLTHVTVLQQRGGFLTNELLVYVEFYFLKNTQRCGEPPSCFAEILGF